MALNVCENIWKPSICSRRWKSVEKNHWANASLSAGQAVKCGSCLDNLITLINVCKPKTRVWESKAYVWVWGLQNRIRNMFLPTVIEAKHVGSEMLLQPIIQKWRKVNHMRIQCTRQTWVRPNFNSSLPSYSCTKLTVLIHRTTLSSIQLLSVIPMLVREQPTLPAMLFNHKREKLAEAPNWVWYKRPIQINTVPRIVTPAMSQPSHGCVDRVVALLDKLDLRAYATWKGAAAWISRSSLSTARWKKERYVTFAIWFFVFSKFYYL